MKFFSRLFNKDPQTVSDRPAPPFQVGDRVRDCEGNGYMVTAVDPEANHGAGNLQTRRDDGQEFSHWFFGHGYTKLSEGEKVNPVPYRFVIEKWKPDESSLGAYLREGRILLQGDCITNIGGLACDPCKNLDAAIPNSVLGDTLLTVLNEAMNTPIPEDGKGKSEKLLKIAGVRSWKKLCEEAAYCHVGMTPTGFSISPSRSAKGGFDFLGTELNLNLSKHVAPEELGRALREGFSRCQ